MGWSGVSLSQLHVLLLLVLSCTQHIFHVNSYLNEIETKSLYSLYKSLGGSKWSLTKSENWMFDDYGVATSDPCLFRGIECKCTHQNSTYEGGKYLLNITRDLNSYYFEDDDFRYNIEDLTQQSLKNCSVTKMLLTSMNLNGTLQSGIFKNFTSLKVLRLDNNSIHGPIPSDIFLLTQLSVLTLSNNNFTGLMSPSISKLRQLKQLNLRNNRHMKGQLPMSIGNLTQLQQLILTNCSFNGSIPSTLGKLSKLKTIALSSNKLRGEIPLNLSSLPNLKYMILDHNSLTGTIPANIGGLYNLTFLDLSRNSLHRAIPSSISLLKELQYLDLSGNSLSSLSPSFSSLSKLQILELGSNQLFSTIPSFLGGFTSLQRLNLSNNIFSGTIPSSFQNLVNMQRLDLSLNNLVGEVPSGFSNLKTLTHLLLQRNNLSTELSFLDTLTNLQVVDVSSNKCKGGLPFALFENANNLTHFISVMNQLTGTLSERICSSKNLKFLVLARLHHNSDSTPKRNTCPFTNYFHGPLPSCLLSLPHLDTLILSGNHMSGTIPNHVIVSPTLKTLKLSNNKMSGPIPINILQHKFEDLDLSFNHFTGDLLQMEGIPNCSLKLNSNRLSNILPQSIIDAGSLTTSKSCSTFTMDVLDGNFFDCVNTGADRSSQLPSIDPKFSFYRCGSHTFDNIMYTFLTLFGVSLALVIVVFRVKYTSLEAVLNKFIGWSCKFLRRRQQSLWRSRVADESLNKSSLDENVTASHNIELGTKNDTTGRHCDGFVDNSNHHDGGMKRSGSIFQYVLSAPVYLTVRIKDLVAYLGFLKIPFIVSVFEHMKNISRQITSKVKGMFEQFPKWMKITSDVEWTHSRLRDIDLEHVRELGQAASVFRSVCMIITFISVIFLTPLYTGLGSSYSTYTKKYAFSVSLAFLSGVVPGYTIAVVLTLYIISISLVYHHLLNKGDPSNETWRSSQRRLHFNPQRLHSLSPHATPRPSILANGKRVHNAINRESEASDKSPGRSTFKADKSNIYDDRVNGEVTRISESPSYISRFIPFTHKVHSFVLRATKAMSTKNPSHMDKSKAVRKYQTLQVL